MGYTYAEANLDDDTQDTTETSHHSILVDIANQVTDGAILYRLLFQIMNLSPSIVCYRELEKWFETQDDSFAAISLLKIWAEQCGIQINLLPAIVDKR